MGFKIGMTSRFRLGEAPWFRLMNVKVAHCIGILTVLITFA